MRSRKEMALIHVIEAVERALCKYSSANVDVMRNEETNALDIVYHSRHNSFSIENNVAYFSDFSNIRTLENALDDLDVGYVW